MCAVHVHATGVGYSQSSARCQSTVESSKVGATLFEYYYCCYYYYYYSPPIRSYGEAGQEYTRIHFDGATEMLTGLVDDAPRHMANGKVGGCRVRQLNNNRLQQYEKFVFAKKIYEQ